MPSFRLDEYEALTRWMKENTRTAVQRGFLSAGIRLLGVIQNEIIPAEKPPPIFDRVYAQSWRVEPTDRGVDLVNDLPYASVIERGARAENIKIGRKMIEALAEWVRRKGLTGHPPGERHSPEAVADARQIAWAIARAMQGTNTKPGKGIFNRDGTQGLHIADKAARRAPEIVEQEVVRELKRAMK